MQLLCQRKIIFVLLALFLSCAVCRSAPQTSEQGASSQFGAARSGWSAGASSQHSISDFGGRGRSIWGARNGIPSASVKAGGFGQRTQTSSPASLANPTSTSGGAAASFPSTPRISEQGSTQEGTIPSRSTMLSRLRPSGSTALKSAAPVFHGAPSSRTAGAGSGLGSSSLNNSFGTSSNRRSGPSGTSVSSFSQRRKAGSLPSLPKTSHGRPGNNGLTPRP